jgi:branched-chain amino acid transport system substrate-binding protein
VADIRKRTGGKVPTARTWFGYTAMYSLALVANREKTLDSVKLAQALGDFELPAEVKLQPNKCYYRKGDHQLMTSAFIGEALPKGAGDPEDLFRVDSIVAGDKTSPAVSETGCTLQWPA